MGMIEEFWDDITVYYVEFTAKTNKAPVKKFRKMLIFKADIRKNDLDGIIKKYFNGIIEVTHIDEIDEGLCLKKQFETLDQP
ncbi:hypothetical protein ACOJIU_18390 (plasmid) [Carnobacterium maltaromaticum]